MMICTAVTPERVGLCGLPIDLDSSYAINRFYFFHFRTMYRGHLALRGPDDPDVLFYFQQLRFYAACLIAAMPSTGNFLSIIDRG
ncbi:hypothetical protein [Giesbergeria anulus]|nr:hypothetical protein [Giesbergeria anulus]